MTSTTKRADPFAESADLDLTAFAPKPKARPDAEKVRAVSEANQFPSRAGAAATPAAPAKKPEARPIRRRRTGRSVQFNIKATQEAIDRFVRLSDQEGWVFGETLEHALDALERERARKT